MKLRQVRHLHVALVVELVVVRVIIVVVRDAKRLKRCQFGRVSAAVDGRDLNRSGLDRLATLLFGFLSLASCVISLVFQPVHAIP